MFFPPLGSAQSTSWSIMANRVITTMLFFYIYDILWV